MKYQVRTHLPFLPLTTFDSSIDIVAQSSVLPPTPVSLDDDPIIPESILAACQEVHKGDLLVSSDYESLVGQMSGYEKNAAYGYGKCFVHLTL